MKYLMIDTDIGNDCDDAAAAALACMYEGAGLCKLLCFTVNTSDRYAPNCLDAIADTYGRRVKIGVYRGDGFPENPASYCKKVAERFGTAAPRERPEAVALMRRELSSCPDKSVKIVCIGQLNNLCALLRSQADENGTDGISLVREKVCEVVIMGGMFGADSVEFFGQAYTAEYNIATDVPDSILALKLCPVDVTFSDFLLGKDVLTLGALVRRSDEDPVGYAYELFCGGARPSWDVLTVMYAVCGEGELFCRTARGTVAVLSDGRTKFTASEEGRHRILRAASGNDALQAAIERAFETLRPSAQMSCTGKQSLSERPVR